MPIKFLALLLGILNCFVLISILSTSLVLQTFFLIFLSSIFFFFELSGTIRFHGKNGCTCIIFIMGLVYLQEI